MKTVFLKLIIIYQKFFSPDHSFWGKYRYPYGFCRYFPSCSEYTKLAIEKLGTSRGLKKSAWRILRCNPFSSGGYDPINANKTTL